METQFVERLASNEAQKELLDTGLLWVINGAILNPLGLALAFVREVSDDGVSRPSTIELVCTPGRRPFDVLEEHDEEGRSRLRAFLSRASPSNANFLHLFLSSFVRESPKS